MINLTMSDMEFSELLDILLTTGYYEIHDELKNKVVDIIPEEKVGYTSLYLGELIDLEGLRCIVTQVEFPNDHSGATVQLTSIQKMKEEYEELGNLIKAIENYG